jgi:hypothetical protein
MDLIIRHFPLVAIAVVLVNAAIARARIPQLIATGMSTVRLITLVWGVGTIAIPLLMPADRSSTLTCP